MCRRAVQLPLHLVSQEDMQSQKDLQSQKALHSCPLPSVLSSGAR